MPNFTPMGAMHRPCKAKKPHNRPLSNIYRCSALRAMLPVKVALYCNKMLGTLLAKTFQKVYVCWLLAIFESLALDYCNRVIGNLKMFD